MELPLFVVFLVSLLLWGLQAARHLKYLFSLCLLSGRSFCCWFLSLNLFCNFCCRSCGLSLSGSLLTSTAGLLGSLRSLCHCLVEVNKLNEADVCCVTLTMTELDNAGVTTWAVTYLLAYYREQLGIKVVGVTGSIGKTTTKEFIATVLSQKYNVFRTEKNQNNLIGLPLSVIDPPRMFPEYVLQAPEQFLFRF